MKKIITLFISCLTFLLIYAQEQPSAYALDEDYNLWNLRIGDTAYVFAEMAYIRENAGTRSKLVDSLTEGIMVIIKSDGYNNSTIRGFYAPWHQISYVKDNVKKEGFIWLGLLALNSLHNQDGEQFLYGFKKFRPSTENSASYYDAEIKVFDREKKVMARALYQAEVNDQTGTDTKIFGAMGLKNIKNIHRSAFLGEACGIATQYYYFAWNGQELIHFPSKMTISDAGVFYREETILFPSEHKGDPTMIYKNIVEAENIDDNLDDPNYMETKSQIKYRWNGYILSELIELK